MLDAIALVATGIASDVALDRIFRAARDLGPSERAEVSRSVYAVIRSWRKVDAALARGVAACGRKLEELEPAILNRLRVLATKRLEGVDDSALETSDPYAFKRIPGLFKRIRFDVPSELSARSIAESCSLPDFFVARLERSRGLAEADQIARALAGRAPLTLRAGPDEREAVRAELRDELGLELELTPLSPWGLIVAEESAPIRGTRAFAEGRVEPMDEGSQLVALALGARPEESVLDACAGAGGKTLAIAAMMRGTGRIVAVDPDPAKLEELRRRARRAKLNDIETLAADVRELPVGLVGRFDRVLVDAPCTGSGTWRRAPDASLRLEESEIASFVGLQTTILHGATRALRAGGLIVYATCSVLDEENEQVVRAILARLPELAPESLERTMGTELAGRLGATFEARVGPGPGARGPDGFYFAAFRKRLED